MAAKISVLMSTYNGENFLEEQITSILSQKDVEISLLVRDDGSKDNTIDILNDYQRQEKLRWYTGENLGPARSFLHLLSTASNADYYAFSDQDDYWMSDKLKVATDMLSSYSDIPALYFCQTQLADSSLHKMETPKLQPFLSFGESLVYQFIGGCTMVMNVKLKEIICQYSPNFLSMHDVWIYVIAMGIGAKVVFDPVPHILYRQHGNNVVGQGYGWQKAWKRRFERIFKKREHARYRLASELKQGYLPLISEENKTILDLFIVSRHSLFKRWSLISDPNYRCSNSKVYRYFQLSVFLNTF